MQIRQLSWILVLQWWVLAPVGWGQAPKKAVPVEVRLTFDEKVVAKPFTGRVFVLASRKPITDVPPGISWFKPDPFFAMDVEDWQPGSALLFAPGELGYPNTLTGLPAGKYFFQAVMDLDLGGQSCIHSPGNGYSTAQAVDVDPARPQQVNLKIDQVYNKKPFPQSDRLKQVDIESKLLTAFHGRPMRLRAGVILPPSFAKEPARRYPVIYEIPGFSGTHYYAAAVQARNPTDVHGVDMLYVVLDPTCRLGHHVFADSDNNGPYGKALCEELIPYIEKSYRGQGIPSARFVAGHSSGGWSSLWLQITYPDFFGGTWSTAPDPVDFRDFQRVNIYIPGTNIYKDDDGKLRPLARKGKQVLLHYKGFTDMETVMGRGGQLQSFEAVFSPKGVDGKPLPLWDRKTGLIDPAVAKSWQRYDISLIVEKNWPQLSPRLAGKIHIYMGDQDTFYLEGATYLLKETLKRLGSDATVEIFPGRDHSNLIDQALRQRIAREMAESYKKRNN